MVKFCLAALGASFALSGCAQQIAESRVRSAIIDAGLSASTADCMASRMTDELTISQLKKLERLKPKAGEPATPTSLAGFVERVRRVDDPKVVGVTASAALVCGSGLGGAK